MTFGYNANVFENVTTNRVINHANDLLEGLWARRRRCNVSTNFALTDPPSDRKVQADKSLR
jgi:hypothetical protein